MTNAYYTTMLDKCPEQVTKDAFAFGQKLIWKQFTHCLCILRRPACFFLYILSTHEAV